MEKLTAVPNGHEIIYSALIATGTFVLSYTWMELLKQQSAGWTFETILPFFLFLTGGLLVWNRLIQYALLN